MNQPLISVIVPIYNVEKYLNQCIDSIVNQTYRNLEIILVDDGSPDNCPQMCDDWAKKDNRIKVIHKPNGGLSDARNFGIDSATGDYIFFIDSDDFIDNKCIEKLYNDLIINKSDISVTLPKRFLSNHNIKSLYKNCLKGTFKNYVIIENMFKDSIPWSACGKLFKTNLFNNNRFLKNRLCEDLFLIPSIISLTNNVSIIKEDLYYYRYRTNSIMNQTPSEKFLKDQFDSISYNLKFFANSNKNIYDAVLGKYTNYCFDTIACLYQNNTSSISKYLLGQSKESIRRNRKYILKSKTFNMRLKFKCLISFVNINIFTFIRKIHILLNYIANYF